MWRNPPLRVSGEKRLHTLVTSVSSDAHTWNLVYLQLLLEEMGHRVTNLGACVPDQLLLDHCRRYPPDLIVVSSVNGHGVADGARLVAAVRADATLAAIPIVIGGKLDTTGGEESTVRRLRDAGFDAVFHGTADIDAFRDFVHAVAIGNPRVVRV
jgi:methylaspartate mutase sigma subunit